MRVKRVRVRRCGRDEIGTGALLPVRQASLRPRQASDAHFSSPVAAKVVLRGCFPCNAAMRKSKAKQARTLAGDARGDPAVVARARPGVSVLASGLQHMCRLMPDQPRLAGNKKRNKIFHMIRAGKYESGCQSWLQSRRHFHSII